ncbi:MAG TPA: Snf7 family protein [Nitrososphaerales archaeon]|nr:Snf7 family protein [Nitrososphaerales archaeon]
MSQFSSNWEKKRSAGIGERLRTAFNNPGPLKPRLDALIRQINVVISKLDTSMAKIRDRDAALFSKTVAAVQRHEDQRASMFANELAEVRKMGKMVTQSRLALEQIVLRLNTITEMGDIVTSLAPATSIVRSIKQDITGVMPDVSNEMGEVSSLLNGILVDAGSIGGYTMNFSVANEEAERALSEAAAVAESRMKEKFPDIPQAIEPIESETFETA